MFIKINDFDEFLDLLGNKEKQFVSPGYIVNRFGVTRQRLDNWVSRDNLINAIVYEDEKYGKFKFISLLELEKVRDKLLKK